MTVLHTIGSRALARLGVLVASLAMAVAGLAIPAASPAHAAVGDLTCTAAATVNLSPALTPGGSTTISSVNGVFDNCVSANGKFSRLANAGVENASGTASAPSAPGQCPALFTIKGGATLVWNTGERSTLKFVLSTNPGGGTATLNITVTNGPLEDDTIAPVVVQINPNLDCVTNGLKSITTHETQVFFV
ncbi:hypothetical protein [Streptomyces sp. NPDC001404]|uniref:hypothetical protein n=1 Tax=Streptomyces sp. NPDC001404 TaxID=3364571 RepID=UPI0036977D41